MEIIGHDADEIQVSGRSRIEVRREMTKALGLMSEAPAGCLQRKQAADIQATDPKPSCSRAHCLGCWPIFLELWWGVGSRFHQCPQGRQEGPLYEAPST
jgi:hypothetical protein